jgi:hypothetical protein
MSKEKHSESGRHRNERREHDREARVHDEEVYNEPHESKGVRYFGLAMIVIVIVTLTALFMGGFIRW